MIVMIMHQAADQLSKCHHHSMWGCNHLTFKLSTTFLQNLAYTLQQAFSASRLDCESRNYTSSKIDIELRMVCVWIFRVVQNYKVMPLCTVHYEVLDKIGSSFILAFILKRLGKPQTTASMQEPVDSCKLLDSPPDFAIFFIVGV